MRALEELGFVWFPAEERKRKREDEPHSARTKRAGVKPEFASLDSGIGASVDSKVSAHAEDIMNVGGAEEEAESQIVEYKTSDLEKVHKQYNSTLSAFQKANGSLCDAQDILEKSIQRHHAALKALELAQKEMEKACDDVLTVELEQNPDEEWNALYLKLLSRKEKHGDILFAKASICGEKSDDAVENEDGDGEELEQDREKSEQSHSLEVSQNYYDSVSESESNTYAIAGSIKVEVQEEVMNESIKEHGEQDQVEKEDDPEEKLLADWVVSLRKLPKKSIGEWRYKALDKLGFTW
jgi:hypothetical protein